MAQSLESCWAVRLAALGVLLELTVSANLLTWAGVPYVTDGGSLAAKLHPGTDVLFLAFGVQMLQRGGWTLLLGDRLPMIFLAGMAACLVYLLVLTGTGNLIVLLDTFLPAGMFVVVMRRATPGQIARLRRTMQILLGLSAILALVETAARSTLIPLYLNDAAYHPHVEDFRPTALFDHPLTGGVMAMLGLALCPARGLARLAYGGLMWAALIAFGGRMALAASVLASLSLMVAQLAPRLLRRDPRARLAFLTGLALPILSVLLLLAIMWAGFGERLAGHLYWDDSAQVRLAQWQLLDELDAWQLAFGVPRDQLLALLTPLRLGPGVEVIENFWLLMFVSMGAAGFPLFAGSVLALLVRVWRSTALAGRLLLLGVMLVASTSNSLGRKSTILVCLMAAIACLPAGKGVRTAVISHTRFRIPKDAAPEARPA
jgi:hypothetical protein